VEVGTVAQLGGAVPEGREHQVRLLAMKATASEHGPGLDEQHLLLRLVKEVRTELIGEAPAPRSGCPVREVGQGTVSGVAVRHCPTTVRARRHRPHLPADIVR
jgi:hypothetical protein